MTIYNLTLSFLRKQESRAPVTLGKEIASLHTLFITGDLPTKRHEWVPSWTDYGYHMSVSLPDVHALDPCFHRDDDEEHGSCVSTSESFARDHQSDSNPNPLHQNCD